GGPGHKASQSVKNEGAAETGDQRKANLPPSECMDAEMVEHRQGGGVADDEQQDEQPGWKQAEKKWDGREPETRKLSIRLHEQCVKGLERQTGRLARYLGGCGERRVKGYVGSDQPRRWRVRGNEQAPKGRVAPKCVSGSALEHSQRLPFARQALLASPKTLVGVFQQGLSVATGLEQLALDFEDLTPFVAFDGLEIKFLR